MVRSPQDDTALLDTLVGEIRTALPGIIAVYVFGSWGTPDERPGSDMDLAILPPAPVPQIDCWQLAQALAVLAKRDIDLIDLLNASTVMRAQVVAYGRRIYCLDRPRCEHFEGWTFSSYARLNEERRGILRDIRERGRIHA